MRVRGYNRGYFLFVIEQVIETINSKSFSARWCLMIFVLFPVSAVHATNHLVRINEIMAGLNGDPSAQFVEMVAGGSGRKAWGPNGAATGRAMLVFFDAAGDETGQFIFSSNAPAGNDNVLMATQAFVDATGINLGFIIPALISPAAGKVCFKNNPANTAFFVNLCLSYGGVGFTGNTEGAGTANNAILPTDAALSLSRISSFNSGANLNSSFALQSFTPATTQTSENETLLGQNQLGEIVDSDNDGVLDNIDKFSLDPNKTSDTDNDGIDNNADPDDDNDGVQDNNDNFPLDVTRAIDMDDDEIDDRIDADDDNDGILDTRDAFSLIPNDSDEIILDLDTDGIDIWMNNTNWIHLHPFTSEGITTVISMATEKTISSLTLVPFGVCGPGSIIPAGRNCTR